MNQNEIAGYLAGYTRAMRKEAGWLDSLKAWWSKSRGPAAKQATPAPGAFVDKWKQSNQAIRDEYLKD